MFTEREMAYMQSQRLGRLGADDQPDVTPVGIEVVTEHSTWAA